MNTGISITQHCSHTKTHSHQLRKNKINVNTLCFVVSVDIKKMFFKGPVVGQRSTTLYLSDVTTIIPNRSLRWKYLFQNIFYFEEFLQFSFSNNHCQERSLWHLKFTFHSSLYKMNAAFFLLPRQSFVVLFFPTSVYWQSVFLIVTYPLIQITHFFLSSPLHFHILQHSSTLPFMVTASTRTICVACKKERITYTFVRDV